MFTELIHFTNQSIFMHLNCVFAFIELGFMLLNLWQQLLRDLF